MHEQIEIGVRRRQIKYVMDIVAARRMGWSWATDIVTVFHAPAGMKRHERAKFVPQYAIELVFSGRIFTLRVGPEMLSDVAAGRLLSYCPGFTWTSDQAQRANAGRMCAITRDYLLTDTREAADDVIWIMHRLWKLPLSDPLYYRMSQVVDVAERYPDAAGLTGALPIFTRPMLDA